MVCVREAWGHGEDRHLSTRRRPGAPYRVRVLSPARLLYTISTAADPAPQSLIPPGKPAPLKLSMLPFRWHSRA